MVVVINHVQHSNNVKAEHVLTTHAPQDKRAVEGFVLIRTQVRLTVVVVTHKVAQHVQVARFVQVEHAPTQLAYRRH